MRILLLASFSNSEMRDYLHFKGNNRMFQTMLRLFRIPERVGEARDYASWIPNIISEIERSKEIELHVAGPQARLKKHIEEFELRGVNYHFFRADYSSFIRKVNNYRVWKFFQNSCHTTRSLLRKIRPDLVVLSGAENPVTSVCILAARAYPCLCLCQTVYNNPAREEYLVPKRLTQDLEKDIFAKLSYFGVYSSLHYNLLRKFNPGATIFKYGYPSKGVIRQPDLSIKKEYDFVNFALIHGARKGTTDSIQALAIVKEFYPDVRLNIVGGCDPSAKARFDRMIQELGLEKNVFFTPLFEKKTDLFAHIQKSRFAVLPCKLDHTSATMSQAMQLGLPIVVYRTTGTPYFNRDGLSALIAEKDNVQDLAKHMISLIDNPDLADTLKINARLYQEKKAMIAKDNGPQLLSIFRAVYANAICGKPIPTGLLFDVERDD